jgi:hypothetical protein
MVALVILFPGMVLHYRDTGPVADPTTIEFQPPEFGGNAPRGLPPPPDARERPHPPSFAPGEPRQD